MTVKSWEALEVALQEPVPANVTRVYFITANTKPTETSAQMRRISGSCKNNQRMHVTLADFPDHVDFGPNTFLDVLTSNSGVPVFFEPLKGLPHGRLYMQYELLPNRWDMTDLVMILGVIVLVGSGWVARSLC